MRTGERGGQPDDAFDTDVEVTPLVDAAGVAGTQLSTTSRGQLRRILPPAPAAAVQR